MQGEWIFAGQVLGCQRRTEARLLVPAVLLPDQIQDLLTLFLRPGPVGPPAGVAVLQRRCATCLVAFP